MYEVLRSFLNKQLDGKFDGWIGNRLVYTIFATYRPPACRRKMIP